MLKHGHESGDDRETFTGLAHVHMQEYIQTGVLKILSLRNYNSEIYTHVHAADMDTACIRKYSLLSICHSSRMKGLRPFASLKTTSNIEECRLLEFVAVKFL
jgi:hypothetical protein